MSHKVLVLYYSKHGATRAMANKIALGVEQQGLEACLRTVPEMSTNIGDAQEPVPTSGDPFVSHQDIQDCAGIALGSPTRFGNMAAPLKHFIDSTSALWLSGVLENKPACVFTSTSSMHGGQESTLLSMALPLLHHGMLFCGLPYSIPQLHTTLTGGSPYGVTHLAQGKYPNKLSEDEVVLCIEQGKRLATLVNKLRD
ncbi:NAD(P)H:quinone oxidoreductase [Paraglaciecola aquimarina]|uniref:NAD(P)H:quinone oxidoreductase n=1 Tax=Paraglaciecola algarum TaxID=3050085 RepID=A0ABS9D999_9ALTE|nr:NAD(P)H:quinone oxidoreductase [Paraglaciecola sp. G1-23]MCF2948945.1 NAD(P)H:quinone oxidoreductase [Paraglaciecola sp. G1-23]